MNNGLSDLKATFFCIRQQFWQKESKQPFAITHIKVPSSKIVFNKWRLIHEIMTTFRSLHLVARKLCTMVLITCYKQHGKCVKFQEFNPQLEMILNYSGSFAMLFWDYCVQQHPNSIIKQTRNVCLKIDLKYENVKILFPFDYY